MKKHKVFIDGESGTTGLQIRERLKTHPNIDIVSIDYEKRRDPDVKRRIIQSVDVTVLCLPDDAASEAVVLADDVGCRVLDASSAHRTAPGWVFGMAELCPSQRAAIHHASKVSNPGCYSTGAILLLRPLVDAGLISVETAYSITAVSGYTGGGNRLIERYETAPEQPPAYAMYGLDFSHKHLPEIQMWSKLTTRPFLLPSVGNFRQGMLVVIPMAHANKNEGGRFHQCLQRYYASEQFVQVQPFNMVDPDTAPFLTAHGMEGTNVASLSVFGSPCGNKTILVAKLDNLGKGASGAAVQNLNIMLGEEERICTAL